ncbi:hypothetical protein FOPE_12587 [Fonsecaea pedrosoi]|nr:hypothetical protein FOPE_12587 [Fonsecaea pedrosoi]
MSLAAGTGDLRLGTESRATKEEAPKPPAPATITPNSPSSMVSSCHSSVTSPGLITGVFTSTGRSSLLGAISSSNHAHARLFPSQRLNPHTGCRSLEPWILRGPSPSSCSEGTNASKLFAEPLGGVDRHHVDFLRHPSSLPIPQGQMGGVWGKGVFPES